MRVKRFLGPWRAALRRLRGAPRHEGGQAIVEFAFLAPAFIALLCAILEFSGIMFVQAILEGSAREASRYGITGFTSGGVSREDQILAIVQDHTYGIVDVGDLSMETLVYENFGDVGQPEPFEDDNGNEVWDNDEPYTDINGNGTWDPDMGAAGPRRPGRRGGLPHDLRLGHHHPAVPAVLRRFDHHAVQHRRAQRAVHAAARPLTS